VKQNLSPQEQSHTPGAPSGWGHVKQSLSPVPPDALTSPIASATSLAPVITTASTTTQSPLSPASSTSWTRVKQSAMLANDVSCSPSASTTAASPGITVAPNKPQQGLPEALSGHSEQSHEHKVGSISHSPVLRCNASEDELDAKADALMLLELQLQARASLLEAQRTSLQEQLKEFHIEHRRMQAELNQRAEAVWQMYAEMHGESPTKATAERLGVLESQGLLDEMRDLRVALTAEKNLRLVAERECDRVKAQIKTLPACNAAADAEQASFWRREAEVWKMRCTQALQCCMGPHMTISEAVVDM